MKQKTEVKDIVNFYNEIFNSLVEHVLKNQESVGILPSSIKEVLYNNSYFMDSTFEKCLFFNKALNSVKDVSLYFKPCVEWRNLELIFATLAKSNGYARILSVNIPGFVGKIKIHILCRKNSFFSPEERLEKYKKERDTRIWFDYQGSYYDILTGKVVIAHGINGSNIIRINERFVPNNSLEVIKEWLELPLRYDSRTKYVDIFQFLRYIRSMSNRTDVQQIEEEVAPNAAFTVEDRQRQREVRAVAQPRQRGIWVGDLQQNSSVPVPNPAMTMQVFDEAISQLETWADTPPQPVPNEITQVGVPTRWVGTGQWVVLDESAPINNQEWRT